MKKKYGNDKEPFRTVEPRKAKQSDLLQMADIIIGAIGFQKNGYHLLASSRKGKKDLADYIASEAGLENLKNNSPWGENRFTIWNFKLKK